jgi:hypothetical protein
MALIPSRRLPKVLRRAILLAGVRYYKSRLSWAQFWERRERLRVEAIVRRRYQHSIAERESEAVRRRHMGGGPGPFV